MFNENNTMNEILNTEPEWGAPFLVDAFLECANMVLENVLKNLAKFEKPAMVEQYRNGERKTGDVTGY